MAADGIGPNNLFLFFEEFLDLREKQKYSKTDENEIIINQSEMIQQLRLSIHNLPDR